MPDIAVKDANIDEYNIIIFAGGPGAPSLAKHEEVINLIKDAENKGRLIAAICSAPTVLAKAGVLTGKKATVFGSDDYNIYTEIKRRRI